MFLRWSPHPHLLTPSPLSGWLHPFYFGIVFVSCFTLRSGSKTERVRSPRPVDSLSSPPHVRLTDSLSGAAFNWAVEVQTSLHKPRLLNHETWEPPLFYERLLIGRRRRRWSHPHGIRLSSSHHRGELLFTPGFCQLAARWRRRYWFCVFTNVS